VKGVAALGAGLLFGLGLLVSGMVNPVNVVAFLNVTGDWRPALLITMIAAIAVTAPAYAVVCRRGRSLWGTPAPAIDRWHIDRALLVGALLFGIGWGLSGVCPGPSLLLLAGGSFKAVAFILGLLGGMLAVNAIPQDP
jgi:uncharacterized membrane protein YedE/YeeE